MKLLLSIGLGGAIGAIGRYLVMIAVGHFVGMAFPYATLIVNVTGSFLLGLLVEGMALVWQVDETLRAFFVVGVLGAFTTFSTFSLDVVYLFDRGEMLQALLYIVLSVVLSVLAFGAGMYAVRHLVA
ncbi:MAG: fluoride efflux transporter CrcB [Alphaproteobacteria bacterium]|nr:fluoride efflux transporter CrcB [Alphaproteobacteria bacterium]